MARREWMFLAALAVAFAGSARADEMATGDAVVVPEAGADAGAVPEAGAEGGAAPAVAPEVPDSSAASAAPAPEGRMIDLSLSDAVAMAIENNLDVQVARHDPLIAWEDTRIAWGAYDPEAYVNIATGQVETPVATALEPSGQTLDKFWNNEGGLRGVVPITSTQYDISFSGDRTRTNRTISSMREQWTSDLSFNFTQPLLRNLYWNQPWMQVQLSREAYGQSLEDFRGQLMDTVRGVEDAYWSAVATDEQQRVAVKSLEASQKLLEQTKVQYEVGVVSKVEVVEAEAGVAEREVELIDARNAYRTAQDTLIDHVLGAKLEPSSRMLVNPIDRPEEYANYVVDEEEAARKAMAQRPELASLDDAIKQQEILRTFNKNQMAPQIDMVASVGYQGLAGKPCKINPSATFGCTPAAAAFVSNTFGSDFGSSLDNYFQKDGALNWSVGGVFSIPLGNHAPRARKRQAEIQLRRIQTERTRLVQGIVLEIRKAARDLRSAQEGIDAAERRRLAAEEEFRAEGIRLEQGESTPFDVLQRERDLVSAEGQKITAYQRYRGAVAGLERAQGTILERHNIVVEEARRLR